MIILPPDYSIKKYGIKLRLVREEDAAFIVSLRSNAQRTKFMLTLDKDVEKQVDWIREYKKRERRGEDYYFLYENQDGQKACLNRLSHISRQESTCKAAGWIKSKEVSINSMATFILQKEIAFDVLMLDSFYSDIHKDNTRVLQYYNEFGLKPSQYRGDFVWYEVTQSDYKRKLDQVKAKFNLKA